MKQSFIKFCFAAVVAMFSVGNAFTQDTPPNDEIWYTSTDGQVVTPASSSGFGATIVSNTYTSGKGVIKFNGNVTSIGGSAFSYCSYLTSISIPETVTSIGFFAFSDCASLKSINITNSIESIGAGAFQQCSNLTSILIPSSVINIGNMAFNQCSGLETIYVDLDNSIYDSRKNSNAIIETSSNTLLYGCKNSSIPNTIQKIGDYAFQYCCDLTSITIPRSVTHIGKSAFYFTDLNEIIIPNSVTRIEEDAFSFCYCLDSVYVCWESPITLTSNIFNHHAETMTLFVPHRTKEEYQSTLIWGAFDYILEWDATDISDLNTNVKATPNTLYNLQGQRITSPKKGEIYIQGGKKVKF